MAFPKNKSRKLVIHDLTYHWICIPETTLDTPNGISPDESGQLPALPSDIEWCGYEDVYGYNSTNTLIIQKDKIKITFKLDASYFFSTVLNPNEISFLSITPAVVKKCIEYLDAKQLWTQNSIIRDQIPSIHDAIRFALEEKNSPRD